MFFQISRNFYLTKSKGALLTIILTLPFLTKGHSCDAPQERPTISGGSANTTVPFIPAVSATPAAKSGLVEKAMVEALGIIAPHSAVEPCVDDPKAPNQCRTARHAAGPILRSFKKYGIKAPGEKAALLSLIAMETAEFKYQRNIYPGRPGQGTRNMQMPKWNKKYAASIPELQAEFEQVKDDVDAVLDLLVANDDYDFGSAAWYLTEVCPGDIREGLRKGSEAGWKKYITECVETTVTDKRKGYFNRAKDAVEDL